MRHDQAGQLCRGVGMELIITAGPAPRLDSPADGGAKRAPFTVFGSCRPLPLIARIAASKATGGRPETAIVIDRIRVARAQPVP